MNVQASASRAAAVGQFGAWAVIVFGFALSVVIDWRLEAVGRSDLAGWKDYQIGIVFTAATLSAAIVGSALAWRRPDHPVGWLFLVLAMSLSVATALDSYTAYGAIARRGSLPAHDYVATLADTTFIPWLTVLAMILLLTPGGTLPSRVSRLAAWMALGGGVTGFAAAQFREYRGEHDDLGLIENPLLLEPASILNLVGLVGITILHVGLLMAVGLVVIRFARGQGSDRKQLRWLALAGIPFPILVVGAWVAAATENEAVLIFAACGFVAIIPIAAGLAIEQDHLYDVDGLLSRGLTYSLLTALVVGSYAVMVLVMGQLLGDFGGDSQVPAVVATLACVTVALPARRWLQESLDRRFNRRKFEAVAAIRAFVREPSPATTVQQALRNALGSERVTVAYWLDERDRWVDEHGNEVLPEDDAVKVVRRGETIAAVGTGARVEPSVVRAVIAESRPEIENARLRAAIAVQLVEVRESRSRIVAAQAEERHKIERNLHDGAQQRLLALALQLRAAEVGADPERMRSTLDTAVLQLQLAVSDLRELANGLHPAVLADGGLAAALDDLAARSPVSVRLNVTPERFAPELEEAAWFIACEAVANAVKHGRPAAIDIEAFEMDGRLELRVEDDGCGGANPAGNGLRGIADRAEAVGGRLTVRERAAGGTVVRVELPCAL